MSTSTNGHGTGKEDRGLPGVLPAAALASLVSTGQAIDALERALLDGLDVEDAPPRNIADVPSGQLLFMPASGAAYAGAKLASIAPANPDRGLPRIHGIYLLLDGATLAPLRILDGIALTSLRTPAVSALAVRHLAVPDARRLTVFGTGPQAWGHVEAIRAVRPIEHVAVVGRDAARRADFLARCRQVGLEAREAGPESVADADVVACCTTAREPVFPGRAVPEHATVVAMGSHEPDAREVDDELVARCGVAVVEARSAAFREAGDIVAAARAGVLDPEHGTRDLSELVRGEMRIEAGRPRFFKGVGMAWEDLVIAAEAHQLHQAHLQSGSQA